MPSACTAVILKRFSKSDMCAVSCANCACKWDSCRAFVADVGTVERRVLDILDVCDALGVREVECDIFALYSGEDRGRLNRMQRNAVVFTRR